MPQDKALIKNVYFLKGWGPMRLISKFSLKNWKKRDLDKLLKKLQGNRDNGPEKWGVGSACDA